MTDQPAYQVLARKYRPQTFADLIGQDAMVRTLKNAFAADRIAQASSHTPPARAPGPAPARRGGRAGASIANLAGASSGPRAPNGDEKYFGFWGKVLTASSRYVNYKT